MINVTLSAPYKNPEALNQVNDLLSGSGIPAQVVQDTHPHSWVVLYLGRIYGRWTQSNRLFILSRDPSREAAYFGSDFIPV